MQYNWQQSDWPHFRYDDAESKHLLYQYAQLSGKLVGGVNQLMASQSDETYIDLMVSEAIQTSEIEGELLNREDVRSSIKNFLGLNEPPIRVADARTEGLAALMIDVRKVFDKHLTKEKLCQWQSMVVINDSQSILQKAVEVGSWRKSREPMQIVSGAIFGVIGYEKVHYIAPPADRLEDEMARFIAWFNETQNLPGPVKAAIAHLWFESIHPFEDGNGRVGRAIAELALAQDLGHPPLLSLSTEINRDRNDYYNQLNRASCGDMDITNWVVWFSQLVFVG